MIFDAIEKYGDQIALLSDGQLEVSYAALASEADEIARHMRERSLAFLLCKNASASVAGYVGALRHGIVPVLLNAGIDADLLENLCDAYHPAYAWMPEGQAFPGETETLYSRDGYVLRGTDAAQDYALSDDLALLLTTSGSTGSPKLVRQSARNIESNTASIVEYLHMAAADRAITTLPMNYTYGLSILNTHLNVGASVILTDRTLMDRQFWTLLRELEATNFGGVPYVYEMLKKLRFAQMELPSLRYLTQAGGKLSKELSEEFQGICASKGMRFIVMYGQTEATARMAYLPPEYAAAKAGSMGIAIPGGRFELVDEDGSVIDAPDAAGELVYYGENVSLGYAENRFDLDKGDENHGVLHTGDMARRDADGFYYIVGRKKRFLKLFGNRVNLDEVEDLLKRRGIEAACTGEDDSLRIYITDADKEAEATDFLVHHTGISRGGFTVRVIDEIPRNDAGKVLYSALE